MNKTLGLLLLPLVPLSAIGIVSLVDRALPSTPIVEVNVIECRQPLSSIEVPPPPEPTPQPAPLAPLTT